MKKIFTGLVSFCLLTLLILLAFSASLKYMVSDVIDNSGIDKQINSAINSYFEKYDVTVVSKEQVSEIVDELLDSIIENDSDDISNLLVEVVNNNRDKLKSYGISDDDIDNVIYEIEANITNSNNNIKLSDTQRLGLFMYKMVSSKEFRNWIIVCIIICYLLLFLLNKLDSFRDIGISLFVAGIMIKGSCLIIDNVLSSDGFKEKLEGIKINYSYLDRYVYVYIIVGILLIIGYFGYDMIIKEKKALN